MFHYTTKVFKIFAKFPNSSNFLENSQMFLNVREVSEVSSFLGYSFFILEYSRDFFYVREFSNRMFSKVPDISRVLEKTPKISRNFMNIREDFVLFQFSPTEFVLYEAQKYMQNLIEMISAKKKCSRIFQNLRPYSGIFWSILEHLRNVWNYLGILGNTLNILETPLDYSRINQKYNTIILEISGKIQKNYCSRTTF